MRQKRRSHFCEQNDIRGMEAEPVSVSQPQPHSPGEVIFILYMKNLLSYVQNLIHVNMTHNQQDSIST